MAQHQAFPFLFTFSSYPQPTFCTCSNPFVLLFQDYSFIITMYSSKYLESIVKIRLSQLVPEQPTHTLSIGDIVSVDLDKLKQDQTYVIAGRITHTTRDALLEETGISPRRLRHDSAKELHPLMPNYEVYCHAGSHCLDSVKAALGADFECTVRLYCIPPGSPPLSKCEKW